MKHLLNYVFRYLRRLSKEIVIFLPLFLIGIVAFNFFSNQTLFEKTKAAAKSNPKNAQAKLVLGKLLLQYNNLDTAEIELRQVPGLESEKLLEQITLQKKSPGELKEELNYWQQQNTLYPNSRDTLLKLAVLNWKLYRVFEAKKYFFLAKSLDPNNTSLTKIQTNLELN